jgi:hypothetical protein
MSIHPKLKEALRESQDGLLNAASVHLNNPSPYPQMKARFALNVVSPFVDWFFDEGEKNDLAEVARCATEGMGHMVSLLASTAGDDKMEEYASLIISVIMKEVARHLMPSTDEK